MEGDNGGDRIDDHGEGSGPVVWTSAMSNYMLSHLSSLVGEGIRTSSGFKKVHLNMCVRALNDHFKLKLTGDQVKNHLRTWRRRYAKLKDLRKMSSAGWDEDNFIITLEHEAYTNYVAKHKSDAEFLNKPLENYKEMFTIFGNSMATGKFAKSSSDALGHEDVKTENDDADVIGVTNPVDDNGASSPASRPNKRAKVVQNEDDGLIGAFHSSAKRLAEAIEKAASNDVPHDLLQKLESIPGFDDTQKA